MFIEYQAWTCECDLENRPKHVEIETSPPDIKRI